MIRRRKRRLVRPDVQLRVILIAFSVASLVLFAVYNLTISAVWMVAAESGSGAMSLALEELKSSLMTRFLFSIGLALPLSAALGLVFSFKFAGPLYRFKCFFSELKDGRWNVRCRLRNGDDLQDICAAINDALAPLEEFLEENRSILKETRAILGEIAPNADGDEGSHLDALDRRIAQALAAYELRLPSLPGPASEVSSDSETALLEAVAQPEPQP